MSHETILQLILRLGEFLEKEETGKREEPEGKRRVPVLFVEADGYWVSMQREKDREVRLMVSHEGWRRRTPSSDGYELVNKWDYCTILDVLRVVLLLLTMVTSRR